MNNGVDAYDSVVQGRTVQGTTSVRVI